MNVHSLNNISGNQSFYAKSKGKKESTVAFSDIFSSQTNNKQTTGISLSISGPKQYGKLEDSDYDYLASKFNPNNMTQKEYDEFLDYLQDKNVISEEDKSYIGYNGIRTLGDEQITSCYTPDTEIVEDFRDGNLLAFVQSQGKLSSDNPTATFNRSKKLYVELSQILEHVLANKHS